ncbi:UbiE family methyltransferase [Daldinia grandis]|nr:UbiE family methyltransferase [Daldinia grandis]
MAYQNGYLNGGDPNVTKFYDSRRAASCCAYLIPYLKPNYTILDVGCGPGSITADLAALVPNGRVVGVDLSPEIVAQANEQYQAANLSFQVGDAENVDTQFAGTSFDVVHAHMCLLHLDQPVGALKAWYRLCKPGGMIACRDGKNFDIVSLQPELPVIRKTWPLYEDWMRYRGSDPEAGLHKEEWVRQAGWLMGYEGGKLVLDDSRQPHSVPIGPIFGPFLDRLIREGRTTAEEMDEVDQAWKKWLATEGHEFVSLASDMLYIKA